MNEDKCVTCGTTSGKLNEYNDEIYCTSCMLDKMVEELDN